MRPILCGGAFAADSGAGLTHRSCAHLLPRHRPGGGRCLEQAPPPSTKPSLPRGRTPLLSHLSCPEHRLQMPTVRAETEGSSGTCTAAFADGSIGGGAARFASGPSQCLGTVTTVHVPWEWTEDPGRDLLPDLSWDKLKVTGILYPVSTPRSPQNGFLETLYPKASKRSWAQ